MDAIDGYSTINETLVNDTRIVVQAHTRSMGSVPLFTGIIDKAYYANNSQVDYDDIGLEILFECIDNTVTEEINVTPLGQVFTEALRKLDGTTATTGLEHRVLSAVTGSGITVKILRQNGSNVGPEPVGVPRFKVMEHLLERAYRGRPLYETDYEISFINEQGKLEIIERAKIDDLLDELDSISEKLDDETSMEK